MDHPEEWTQLPRHERRKKVRELERVKANKTKTTQKIKNTIISVVIVGVLVGGFILLTKKSPEQVEFEKKVETISLDGKVEEFPIEGRDHVLEKDNVSYKTNPPTSGDHLAEAKTWGVYDEEIDNKAAVHGLEHGGIWITYKDINAVEIQSLKEIGNSNSQSVIVSPRSENENKIVVASWGKMMKLESVDKAIIQKYIDTYKNDSPEKIAK
ncbi:MAG: DUF3105 domain-containing protein [Candidatus Roizmanbacteria bacterium]|nr:DUF3105 domain-containing protein [Candidatus Roizmanbacteria bacterium]